MKAQVSNLKLQITWEAQTEERRYVGLQEQYVCVSICTVGT